ncbi:MAG: hypothetical protein AAFQ68_21425, partial [Bacteroidota bacterium]
MAKLSNKQETSLENRNLLQYLRYGLPLLLYAGILFYNSDLDFFSVTGSAQVQSANDFDGDGILDVNDLDDDNDGILDTDECLTYGPELVANWNFENGYAYWTSELNRGRNNNAATKGSCSAQGWVALSPCATVNGSCPDYFNYNGSTPTGTTVITDDLGTGANVIATSTCSSSSGSCQAQSL